MRVRSQVLVAIALLLLAACQGGEPTASHQPASLVLVLVLGPATPATPATASVGSTRTPTFLVQDAAGRPMAGVPVTVAVSQGHVANAPTVSGAGATSAGDWTLGGTPGQQTLTIVVNNLPPLVIAV